MQDCAVRPVAVAAGSRRVIRPVIMTTGRRSKRSKVKDMWEQQSSIRIWAGTRLHPNLGAACLGQDLPGPARILMLDCLLTEWFTPFYSVRILTRKVASAEPL